MIHNLVEARVQTMYDELRPQMVGFCGCEVCRGDVLVYALNRLTARYVATNEGKVMTELKPKLAGRADMSAVSARVKAKLAT